MTTPYVDYTENTLIIDMNNKQGLRLYFSYNTCVAFYTYDTGTVVSENCWSTTTGKFLNTINPNKKERLERNEFEKQLEAVLNKEEVKQENKKVDNNKELDALYKEASKVATSEVERIARKILKEHKNLEEFVIGMGTWFFADVNGTLYDGMYPICKEMDDFMQDWDEVYRLTGEAMRFTTDGPVITEW
jgi:hypothetical protein